MINLFDIQHFSIQDGPGIRTSVFLKGCPLRCKWCHNPESQSENREMLFYTEKCISCGLCVSKCPTGAQRIQEGTHVFNRALCKACGSCIRSCGQKALEISGFYMSENDVLDHILRDKMFYRESGGVTFTGGEPLLQYKKIRSLIKKCHSENVHTAVETSLYADKETVELLCEDIDLIICDYKVTDSQEHKKYTGGESALILENMQYLLERKSRTMWIRTPVIPGVNDTEKNMRIMGKSLAKYPVARIELLPYHDIGVSKYYALGREYLFDSKARISEEQMTFFRDILKQEGLATVV